MRKTHSNGPKLIALRPPAIALKRLSEEFEPELRDLEHRTREFVLQLLAAYRQGNDPDFKREFLWARRNVKHALKQLHKLEIQIGASAHIANSLSNLLREAHVPRWSRFPMPTPDGKSIVGVQLLEFLFPDRSADPVASLVDFGAEIGIIQDYLKQERRFLVAEQSGLNNLVTSSPTVFWRRGCLEYTLSRIFREQAPKGKIAEAHELIQKIIYKLEQRSVTFDTDKKRCSAIEQKIARLPVPHRIECDRILSARLNLPIPA